MQHESQYLDRLIDFLNQDQQNIRLRSKIIAISRDVGDWDRAETFASEGLRLHPSSADIHAHAGFIALYKRDHKSAANHFEFAISLGHDEESTKYNLALSYFAQTKYKSAIEITNKIPTDNPYKNDILLLRARCYHHLGNVEQSLDSLLQMQKKTIEANGLLSLIIYEANDYETATELANLTLQENPVQLEALIARAGSSLDQEDFEKAKADYMVATRAHPHSGRAWLGRGVIAFREYNLSDAKESLENAAKYMPDHIGTWHNLAWLHLFKGDHASAKVAFENAYKIDHNFGETHGGLAVCAAMENELETAEDHIKRANRLDPFGLSARYAQALVLKAKGHALDASALFSKLLESPHPILGEKPRALIDERIQEIIGGSLNG